MGPRFDLSLWPEPVAQLAREYTPHLVWDAGLEEMGYPPLLITTPGELSRLRARLKKEVQK